MGLLRILGVLLLVLLIVVSGVILASVTGLFGTREESRGVEEAQTPFGEDVAGGSTGGTAAIETHVSSLSLASRPLSFAFDGGKFIYIAASDGVGRGEDAVQRVSLHIVDLGSMEEEFSVVLEEYSLSPPEARPCVVEGGGGSGLPEYRVLGFDGRFAYYARKCPDVPYLYVVDVVESRVVATGIDTSWLAAVEDGVAYMYRDNAVTAVDVLEGRVLWSYSITPSYVFPQPPGPGRVFSGVLKGAWVDGGKLILLLQDSDQATGELVWVYGLIVASEEGVGESYLEAFRVKTDLTRYDIRVGFDGERVYVFTGLLWGYQGEYHGVVALDYLGLDGRKGRLLSREVAVPPNENYFPLYLFVGDGGIGVGYVVERRIVEVTMGGAATRLESPILVFEALTPEGEILWSREIATAVEGGKLLGFKSGSLYFTDGRYIYKTSPSGTAEMLADLGPQGLPAEAVLGAIIAAPILFPFLPFITPDTTTVMVMVDTTLYIYNGPEAQLISVALG
ncbi:hypothetical protein [Aeropyrum camini]|uniref:hypothetical protein n=1 Tax=Aeropyrum camini TaxID=229980 RepID=UPI0011E59439|nr:hypothetical protein [Aeropyrum camini]